MRKAGCLGADFFRRDTVTVARELLGTRLRRRLPDGRVLGGMIVETEAYLGVDDPACHSFGHRRTARTEIMYAEGGFAYVYLIYGLHHCLNAVTRREGEPEAVLIRALAPELGADHWAATLPHLRPHQWLSGPGRLCRALQIDRRDDGVSLDSDHLWIEVTPRIGVDYAGEAAAWPLRFSLAGERAVSGRR